MFGVWNFRFRDFFLGRKIWQVFFLVAWISSDYFESLLLPQLRGENDSKQSDEFQAIFWVAYFKRGIFVGRIQNNLNIRGSASLRDKPVPLSSRIPPESPLPSPVRTPTTQARVVPAAYPGRVVLRISTTKHYMLDGWFRAEKTRYSRRLNLINLCLGVSSVIRMTTRCRKVVLYHFTLSGNF